jgi:hypothetical protein
VTAVILRPTDERLTNLTKEQARLEIDIDPQSFM